MNLRRATRVAALFVTLFAFWQLLSWRLDGLFVALGLVSAALVTWVSTRLFEGVLGSAADTPRVDLLRLLGFVAWLLSRMPRAGVEVARVVVDRRVPPRPGVVHLRTGLASPAARALLANSVTVIPGTVILDMDGDELVVHAFTPWEFEDLATGAMQRRVAAVFRQDLGDPPELVWEGPNPIAPTDRTLRRAERDAARRDGERTGEEATGGPSDHVRRRGGRGEDGR